MYFGYFTDTEVFDLFGVQGIKCKIFFHLKNSDI